MSDLSSLMNVAPLNASYMMGQNNALDQQSTMTNQMNLQQLMQQRAAQEQRLAGREPMELEKMGLANQTAAAGIPGIQADSRKKGTDADLAAGTLQSDIDLKNFKSQDEMVSTTAKQLSAMVGNLDSIPDYQKPAAVRSAISQLGLKGEAADRLWQKLANVPPNQLGSEIKKISDNMLRANAAYAQAMDQQRSQNEGHMATTVEAGKTARSVEQMRIDAGKYEKKKAATDLEGIVQSELLKAAGSAKAQYAILSRASAAAQQAGMPDLATKYQAQMAAIEPQVQAEISAPKPGGVDPAAVSGLATVPPASIHSPASGNPLAGASAPQAGRIRVTGPDGKTGTIPAGDLDKALKQGYKKVQ